MGFLERLAGTPSKEVLPADPGFGRQLTRWSRASGSSSETARFYDEASNKVFLVTKHVGGDWVNTYSYAVPILLGDGPPEKYVPTVEDDVPSVA